MRPWRIIYNDDGSDVQSNKDPKDPNPANRPTIQELTDDFLGQRLRKLQGTQVDLVIFDPFRTELVPTYPAQSPYFQKQMATANPPDKGNVPLLDVGEDILTLAQQCCHSAGIDFFVTFRMNDAQDTVDANAWGNRNDLPVPFLTHFNDWWGIYHEPLGWFSRWKLEHAECLLGGKYLEAIQNGSPPLYDPQALDPSDPRFWWTAKNYAKPVVRERQLAAIRDVCERTPPPDGIELDFLRGPMFFAETYSRAATRVSQRNVEIMTQLVTEIRALTRARARDSETPLLVTCRVPESKTQSLFIGLDVESWLRDNLIDGLFVGGGYHPMGMMEPVQDMVDLGWKYNVPVYACISKSGMLPYHHNPLDPGGTRSAWRGAAQNIHYAHATNTKWMFGNQTNPPHAHKTGVYVFNLFDEAPRPPDPVIPFVPLGQLYLDMLSELGDTTTLRGSPKTYGLDTMVSEGDLRPGFVVQNDFLEPSLRDDPRIPRSLPQSMIPNEWSVFRLAVGEDILANTPANKTCVARLRVQLPEFSQGDAVDATVNGHPIGAPIALVAPGSTFGMAVIPVDDPAWVIPGINRIAVRIASAGGANTTAALSISRLDLVVDYQ